ICQRVHWGVSHYILHSDDTPERIARGVAIGVLVGWIPLVGIQMLTGLLLAAILRANKAATLPGVWITNPFTFVPIYWFNYKFGHLTLTGQWTTDLATKKKIADLGRLTLEFDVFQYSYWSNLFGLAMNIGRSLWIGSVVLGVILA